MVIARAFQLHTLFFKGFLQYHFLVISALSQVFKGIHANFSDY